MQPQPETMAEVQTERRHLGLKADLGCFGELLGRFIRAHTGLQHLDRVIHPLSRFLVRFALRTGRAANGKRAVIACSIADERMDDVEICLIPWTNQAIREVMRMRAAPFAGNRVDSL